MSSVCEAASSEAAEMEALPLGVGEMPSRALKLGLGGIRGGVRDLRPEPTKVVP